jgi:lipoate-protein ligase A
MDADVAMLDAVAAGGSPRLRVYRWWPPALSLGRFQADAEVDRDACAARGVEVVRRPTGGRALLHGADVTYAVAMTRPAGRAGTVAALYERLAAALVAALARLGVAATVGHGEGPSGPACFAAARGADLRAGGRKVCGSAQLQREGCVLQHGSLRCSPLPVSEADLLRFYDDTARAAARERLAASTVTLAELGAPHDARRVADVLAWGFARTLDVEWRSTAHAAGDPDYAARLARSAGSPFP